MRLATIVNLQDDAIPMSIVDGAALQISHAASLEHAEETVRTENREIVSGLTAGGNTPSIGNLGV
jgi:hypothetical protein